MNDHIDWLIATKLVPPLSNRFALRREGLLERLDNQALPRLVMLNAPPGYGKTSLLNQIRSFLLDGGAKVGWVSLDEDDADSQVLLAYTIAALEKAGVNLNGLSSDPAQGESDDLVRRRLSMLVSRCAAESGQVVIIFDDYHRIGGSLGEQLVRSLLERLPSNLHLVIATRKSPNLPLASLRVNETLIEFSTADMKMDFKEAQSLLTAGQSGDVSDGDVALVLQRSEGWPIVLQMARAWLDRRGKHAAVIKSFSGRLVDLAAYLTEQVLLALPEDMQTVLMRIALVEQVSGDLLNELCDRSDGGALLERFEAQNMLLSRLDEEGNWYRFHMLFSEFLVERLKRTDATSIPHLYKKAAQWFEQQGLLAEALRLAWGIGEPTLAAELVDKSGGWRLFLDGRVGILRTTIGKLNDQQLLRLPRLALSKTILLGKSGKSDEALAWFDKVRIHTKDFSDSLDSSLNDNSKSSLATEARFVRLVPELYRDALLTPMALDMVRMTMKLLPDGDEFLLAICENSLCMYQLDICNYQEALASGERARASYRLAGSVYGELYISLLEGSIYLAQGRLRDAEMLFAEARKKALATFGEGSEMTSLTEIDLAEVLYERDQVEEASAMLEKALPIVEQYDSWHAILLSSYVTLAKIRRRQVGLGNDIPVIDQGIEQAIQRKMSRLQMALQLQRIVMMLRNGLPSEAMALASQLDLEGFAQGAAKSVHSTPKDLQVACMVLARLDLSASNSAKALARLMTLVDDLTRLGCGRHLVEAMILRARAHFELGQVGEALEDFDRAISLAMFENMTRVFVDEAVFIGPILEAAVQAAGGRGANGLKARFLSNILEKARQEDRQIAKSSRPCGLSERELEILVLLDRGHSNKLMARKLDVSESTIKFHLRNLFAKLGVHTRDGAVQAYRKEFGVR